MLRQHESYALGQRTTLKRADGSGDTFTYDARDQLAAIDLLGLSNHELTSRTIFSNSSLQAASLKLPLTEKIFELLLGKLCYQDGAEAIRRENEDCERICRDRANNHQRETIDGKYRAEWKKTCNNGIWGPTTHRQLTNCDAAACSSLGQCYYQSGVSYKGLSNL